MITKNSALFIKMTKIATKADKLLSMRQKLSVNDKIRMTKTQLGDSPTLKTAKTLINVLSSITYSVCLTHHNAHIFCVQNFQADAWFTNKLVSVSIPGRTPMTYICFHSCWINEESAVSPSSPNKSLLHGRHDQSC